VIGIRSLQQQGKPMRKDRPGSTNLPIPFGEESDESNTRNVCQRVHSNKIQNLVFFVCSSLFSFKFRAVKSRVKRVLSCASGLLFPSSQKLDQTREITNDSNGRSQGSATEKEIEGRQAYCFFCNIYNKDVCFI
jgi:hypothetical protein